MHPVMMDAYASDTRARLRAQGLAHLDTLRRGSHVVVYSRDPDGGTVNRARLTWQHGQTFALGIADHHGRWAATGETGTVETLLAILMERFGFILADWS